MSAFDIRFKVLGSHVHCRVFHDGANCGTIIVRRGQEFASFIDAFSKANVIGDDPEVGIAEASRS